MSRTPMYSSKSCLNSGLMLKALTNFKFHLQCEVMVQFHSFAWTYSVFLGPFIEEAVLFPLYILTPLSYIGWPPIGFISGLSILFHYSCVFLCQ